MPKKVNIQDKLGQFSDFWNPRIVAKLNNHQVKLAKLKGEFVWHKHDNEDEMFYVITGQLIIEFRDKKVVLNPGEFIVVPKGIEHKPIAENEVEVMLLEPASTLNTGNVIESRTRNTLEEI